MAPLILTVPEDNRILFFTRDRDTFGFLSNFHEAPIIVDGQLWRSTEFYYQTQKSHDPEYREAVRNAKSANHAKALGSDPTHSRKNRKRSWFNGRMDAMCGDWHEAKMGIMLIALRAKFSQNSELRAMLLATGTAEIIEDSAHDSFWGIGRDGQGQNWLGRLLVQVREELRHEIAST